MSRAGLSIAALVMCCWGIGQIARATYIHGKASLAQALIRRAWVERATKGGSPRPWPWADTTPVARLGAPSHRVDLVILEGGSGSTLAFGPGHVTGTAMPGDHGNSVIGGHRDTHFGFLKDLRRGEVLRVEAPAGDLVDYVVTGAEVVEQDRSDLLGDFGDDRLTLVTCYPFDAIQPGGSLRYVVTARRCAPQAPICSQPGDLQR